MRSIGVWLLSQSNLNVKIKGNGKVARSTTSKHTHTQRDVYNTKKTITTTHHQQTLSHFICFVLLLLLFFVVVVVYFFFGVVPHDCSIIRSLTFVCRRPSAMSMMMTLLLLAVLRICSFRALCRWIFNPLAPNTSHGMSNETTYFHGTHRPFMMQSHHRRYVYILLVVGCFFFVVYSCVPFDSMPM